MAQTQLNPRAGSNNTIFDLSEDKPIKKSHFPFSMKKFDTIDVGDLVPIDWYPVFLGDKVKQKIRYILNTLPLEVPPMTNFYVRTHWYFIKKSALWEGWETFITKGRSGGINLSIPTLSASDFASTFGNGLTAPRLDCPSSLACHLGLPPRSYPKSDSNVGYQEPIIAGSDSSTTGVTGVGYLWPAQFSALIFMAYQKIWRYNYAPANLLQDNKIYFPDNLSTHWWINYSGTNLQGLAFVPEGATMPTSGQERDWIVPQVGIAGQNNDSNCCNLGMLRYANYGKDYFTTAKPWLVRGEEKKESLNLTGKAPLQFFADLLTSMTETDSDGGIFSGGNSSSSAPEDLISPGLGSSTFADRQYGIKRKYAGSTAITSELNSYTLSSLKQSFQKRAGIDFSKAGAAVGISANLIRNLLAHSVWQERATLTDGSYREQMRVHFGRRPPVEEYEPHYLGGTTDVISFAPVVQTSASQEGQPIGTKGALGSSASGSDVFDFDVPDHGYIIGLMFISPETIYQGNIDRDFTDLSQEQQFMPEKANLGFEAIFNQELFARANASDNLGLWGYQTKYAYLKHRRNQACGMFALPVSVDRQFGSQVIRRMPSSNDKLSAQWVSLYHNVSRDWLSYFDYPAFKLQLASDVSLVRALPFQSTPETFGF